MIFNRFMDNRWLPLDIGADISPSINFISKSQDESFEGENVDFTVNASGGVGDLKYKFIKVINGVEEVIQDFSSENTCSIMRNRTGSVMLKVEVKDSLGNIVRDRISHYWKGKIVNYNRNYDVYVKKPKDWNENLHCYAYIKDNDGNTRENAAWHGEEMEYLGNDVYGYKLPSGFESSKIIINDGGTKQYPANGQEGLEIRSGESRILSKESNFKWETLSKDTINITNFTANLTSPQLKGTSVEFTANANGGVGGSENLKYRFLKQDLNMGNIEEVKAYGEENSVTISSDEAAEYIIKVEVKDLSNQVKSDSISFTWKEENVQPPQTLPSQTAPSQTTPSQSNHTSSNADPSNTESKNGNFGSESTESKKQSQSQESTKSFENSKSENSKSETNKSQTEKQTKQNVPQKNETTKASDDVKSETKEDKTKIPSTNESQTKSDKKESQISSSETKTDKNESRTKSNKSETLDKIGNNETLKSYQNRGASSSRGNSSGGGRVISVAKNTKNNETNRKLATKTKTNLWFYDEKGWSADEIGGNSIRETWKELEWQGKLNWYYFGKDGYMLTGWQWINGKCYLLDVKTGMLYVNTTTPDGYKVNANGEWVENGVVQIK